VGYKSSGRDLADRLSGNILAVFSDFSWNNGSFNNPPPTYIWSGRTGRESLATRWGSPANHHISAIILAVKA